MAARTRVGQAHVMLTLDARSRSLEGRHVVITGASSGIGEACVREAARQGARITLVARRKDLLETLAASCSASCHVIACDLSVPPPADWLDEAEAKLGPIDVLVNNAGMENTGAFLASNEDVGQRLLGLNLLTPILVTRRLLPKLVARKGAVVNVASVAALVPAPGLTWYAASKAGLAAFSEALRSENPELNVLTVYPGPVTTPMAETVYATLGGRTGMVGMLPEGRPDVLARRIVRALDRRAARLIYPRFFVIARLLPWLGRWIADRGARLPALKAPLEFS
jgi:short-subunit dehydrogenase